MRDKDHIHAEDDALYHRGYVVIHAVQQCAFDGQLRAAMNISSGVYFARARGGRSFEKASRAAIIDLWMKTYTKYIFSMCMLSEMFYGVMVRLMYVDHSIFGFTICDKYNKFPGILNFICMLNILKIISIIIISSIILNVLPIAKSKEMHIYKRVKIHHTHKTAHCQINSSNMYAMMQLSGYTKNRIFVSQMPPK